MQACDIKLQPPLSGLLGLEERMLIHYWELVEWCRPSIAWIQHAVVHDAVQRILGGVGGYLVGLDEEGHRGEGQDLASVQSHCRKCGNRVFDVELQELFAH